ncbi:hypothetical protein SLS62_010948 [Diatrype stigma]|uniref:Heterokaryon incompatibility domain-containing protein n=1 Tax=Diatrype stigma TaxID=117547 RepID=A0AAN9YGS4_9PEZI
MEAELLSTMNLCSGFFLELASRRPWFSRVWIIQELAMAQKDPLVVCGEKSTSWSTFMKAWKLIARAKLSELGTVHRKGLVGDQRTEQDNTEVAAKLKIDVLDDIWGDQVTGRGEPAKITHGVEDIRSNRS